MSPPHSALNNSKAAAFSGVTALDGRGENPQVPRRKLSRSLATCTFRAAILQKTGLSVRVIVETKTGIKSFEDALLLISTR